MEFLLLDRQFPRAIHYAACARESVHAISGTAAGMFRNPVERLLGELPGAGIRRSKRSSAAACTSTSTVFKPR